ncbi:MAG: rod shape-determining protein RodA [Elusimicrobia bacterium]|nr:rod shape-determining protein RodA [Elusimicrobiota bacterium]
MTRETKRIWACVLLIIGIGLLALYSATYQNVRVSSQHFFSQVFFAVLGIALMGLVSRVPYRFFYDAAYVLYGACAVLLLVVLVAGHSALGATRWFTLAGIRFQPSELTKVAVIFLLARYFSSRHPRLSFDVRGSAQALLQDLVYPGLLTGGAFLLIFLQPDLGTALLVFGIFVVMLYASGIRHRVFWVFLGLCLAFIPVGLSFLKPYQKSRLLVFLNPNIDPMGAGYTIIQSRIAIGSGQIFGKGWLAGTQNQLNFLPERHTDFIFPVIGEEWGFLGGAFLLFCYFVLIHSGLIVASRMKDRFGYLLAVGIVTILSLQVIINMGMTMGASPVVGITLPFVSYGGTSFLVSSLMVGILLGMGRRRPV